VPNLGSTELIILLVVVLLVFGAKRLPDSARSLGRSLRIFKAETKGLMDDDDDKDKTPEQRQIDAAGRAEASGTDTTVQQPHPERER